MSEIDLLIEELEDIENNPIKPFVAIRIRGYLRNYKYHEYRIAELEAYIGRLIEVGEKMFTAVIAAADSYDEGMREWDKIVNDWKEG